MVARSKLYAQLDLLEEELDETLIPHLQEAAKGKNEYVFCAKRFVPYVSLRKHADKVTAELIELCSDIFYLRDKLGEPLEETNAGRLCEYCEKWGKLTDRHRNSAQDLAIQFLKEINT
tara:strand:- start:1937 stop:2290 length:354 start_codon:yes stop_codon:yes gene_type:complete